MALPGRGGAFTLNARTTENRNGRAELRRRYHEARRPRRATFERSEILRRAGVIEVSAVGANTARGVERMEGRCSPRP